MVKICAATRSATKRASYSVGSVLGGLFLALVLLAPRRAAAADVDGFYLNGSAGFLWGIQSTHGWNSGCPVLEPSDAAQAEAAAQGVVLPSWSPSCSTTPPLGAMLEGRIGLRFRYIGLEGFLLGGGDWTSASLTGDLPSEIPDYAKSMQIGRVGGGPGIGLRLMTKPKGVQLTGGVGGGFLARFVYTNVSSLDGSSVSYIAPMVRADLSLVFAKHFVIGVMGWAEFSGDVEVRPDISVLGLNNGPAGIDLDIQALNRVLVFSGTQYFLSPYIGFQFGK
jgi:hypothetical protein